MDCHTYGGPDSAAAETCVTVKIREGIQLKLLQCFRKVPTSRVGTSECLNVEEYDMLLGVAQNGAWWTQTSYGTSLAWIWLPSAS